MNVLNAMHLLAYCWNEMTPLVIQNCFRHCGFVRDANTVAGEVGEQENNEDEDFPGSSISDNYASFDDNVLICSDSTDEEIVATITQQSDELSEPECDDNSEETQPPTREELWESCKTLRRFVNHTGELNSLVEHFEKLLVKEILPKRQTKIVDYFNTCEEKQAGTEEYLDQNDLTSYDMSDGWSDEM